ncbi:chromosome segregation protein SMC [Paenalkalicoccus suaedae]|uniref:Chromosome partition protein Smc n=1 Tax=Paenalkalicoccus suaedae TaxID=2592382 RepID=A0A859FKD5_9BACI|nr:chromosome segregation protein SMC [Paenalkalicoccus suaedae]QKS73246.1 chromosome segregation protein SMC [Paenalkalicoccus suaedae]
MFLKRLELTGFKSFADPLSIDFVSGATAVVGPNGSGKSNISDSIRWVLGEQSARNLRGAKMEDVIFSGSDTRPPLNMAEVSLVLNNEQKHLAIDYTEVAVTRRVYRTGDSEYLINNQPCRLKDIVELFMDSGLGRESFSIIGQGRVEEILSSKSEDRRAIFEEAAGVLKYKTRKLQSEKKLTDTQDNLNRVRDILHELEQQVEPLKEQAAIAREYLDQRAELKQIETGLLAFEIEDLHEKWTNRKEELENLEARKQRLEATATGMEAKVARQKAHIKTLDQAIEELQESLLHISESLEKQEGLKQVLVERNKNYAQNKHQYVTELNELRHAREELAQKLEDKQHELVDKEQLVAETRAALHSIEKELAQTALQSEATLEDLKADYIDLLNKQASLKNERTYVVEQLEKYQSRQVRKSGENKDLVEKRTATKEQLQQAHETLSNVKKEIDDLLAKHQELKVRKEKKAASYDKNQTLYYEGLRHLQQLEARYETLVSMQQEYAGFFQGVKELLKERDRSFKGLHGAVAEMIDVRADYQTAIDIALGASQQHVIVEDEATGRSAIAFLKERRLGRATFLPMNVVKSRLLARADELEGMDGYIGVASELIKTEDRYQHVIRHLLGNVVIATDLTTARAIAQRLNYRTRIVTLEGDVVNPGGAMTGGSLQKKQGQLLGRQQEMDSLTGKITTLQNQTKQLEEELQTAKGSLATIEEEQKEVETEGEELRSREREAKMLVDQQELALSALNDRLQVYDLEQREVVADVEDKEDRLKELEEELAKTDVSIRELNTSIEEASSKKELDDSAREELQRRRMEKQIALATKQEQVTYAKESTALLKEEWTKLHQDIVKKEEAHAFLEKEASSETMDQSEINQEIEKKRTEKEQMWKRMNKLRLERDELQNGRDALETEVKETSKQVQYITQVHHDAEIKLNRLDVELDTRLTRLQEEYELSFDRAKREYPLEIEYEDALEQVKLLKMSLEELGDVNVGAIEEYERVSERYIFLLDQKEDLEQAKAALHSVIEEMDEEMTRRFKETFEEIKGHFEQVFTQMFGGGTAELKLTNKDDILHTGVDIIAQPPGKKLQHLGLLSGGERALTAIALLFSILKVRPVPFCVLDEVEAALDEANVVRFATYLKEFSQETQFIVVTHRKGTMEKADVLYGVTMQESGVSNLVSVKLEESQHFVGTQKEAARR